MLTPEPLQGWTPLSQRACFLLTGADRVRYLNGQITNQVEHLPPGQARYAVVTNHKGQLEAELHFASHPDKDGLLIDSPLSLRESLFTRLDRYIIADDAELSDITDDWQIAHALGVAPDISSASFKIANERFGQAGMDLWFSKDVDLAAQFPEPPLAASSLENQRICQGIPAWDFELTPGLLPPEARLETRAIDYQKGCYIGQEVISRIKSAGKVNRRLVLLKLDAESSTPGLPASLWLSDTESQAKPIGTVTSITTPGVGSEVLALGYLKSQHAEAGTQVLAGPAPHEATTRLTVLTFPQTN